MLNSRFKELFVSCIQRIICLLTIFCFWINLIFSPKPSCYHANSSIRQESFTVFGSCSEHILQFGIGTLHLGFLRIFDIGWMKHTSWGIVGRLKEGA
jgi:hypothetical protein